MNRAETSMEYTPLVSFLVVAYNHEQFIGRAIESVLAQDYPTESLEVVVIDDGSTDATPERIKPYLDRITYIRKPNEGPGSTFNPALARATGEFITFLDGDDMAAPEKVRRLVEVFRDRPDVGLAYGEMAMIDENDQLLAPSYLQAYGLPARRGKVLGHLLKGNFISGGAMLLRASLKHLYWPMPRGIVYGDWWVALRIAQEANIEYVPHVVNLYRKHAHNFSLDPTNSNLGRHHLLDARMRRFLLSEADPTKLTIRELLDCYVRFERNVEGAASLTSSAVEGVVPVGPEDQQQAARLTRAGIQAFEEKNVHTALNLWVRALAADPWCADARAIIQSFIPQLSSVFNTRPQIEPPSSEVVPLLLDGRRSFAFLLHPDWTTPAWQEALLGYVRAFRPEDDVTLVVYLDPSQEVPGAARAEAVAQVIAASGLQDQELPDVLLVSDRLDAAGLERLHAAVDVVLAGSDQDAWIAAFETFTAAA